MSSSFATPAHAEPILLDGRLCLYLPAQQHVVVLNESATVIWSLAQGRTAADVAVAAADLDGWGGAEVDGRVRATLRELVDVGALEEGP